MSKNPADENGTLKEVELKAPIRAVQKKKFIAPGSVPGAKVKVHHQLIGTGHGHPKTVSKTIVVEYDIGQYPADAAGSPCQVLCHQELPNESYISDDEYIAGITLQPIMTGEEWPDTFATRIINVNRDERMVTFLVQRTDNPHEGWGNPLRVCAAFHVVSGATGG